MSDWLGSVLKIRTSNEEFYRLYHQALEDMAGLRFPIARTVPQTTASRQQAEKPCDRFRQ